ncbi:MATE family efflux transporter [Clostridium sp.]|uniref:MATE family efflux transporter n=1 Tax=Clostridium sp. TaxID=1506 RepID=UPI003216E5B1
MTLDVFKGDKGFYKKMFAIAIPITLQNLITIGINMADTMMLGSLGEVALSASSLANQFTFIFMVIHFGLSGGAGVLTGQFWGKGDKESIGKTMSIMFKMSAIVCIAFFILGQFFPQHVMRVYTPDPSVIGEGVRYLKILSFVFLVQGFSLIAIGILRTVGVVKLALVSTSISFVLNIFLNWMFIFGNLGAPALGTAGAAVGTLISRIIEFIIVIGYLLFIDKKVQFKLKSLFYIDKKIFKDYFRHGTPVLISDFILVIGLNMLAVIMGRMGADMVAANSITAIVQQLATVFLMGVSSSSGVIIGNTVGSGDYKKAEEYGKIFLVLSIIIGVLAGILIFTTKDMVISFYNVSDATKVITRQLMNASAVLVTFQAVSSTLTKGVLRAGGDTKFLMVADVLFLWLVSIPLGSITGLIFSLSPGIVFLCLKIDEVIKAIWCSKRLIENKWIKNVTEI